MTAYLLEAPKTRKKRGTQLLLLLLLTRATWK